jgi:hypothetical protein
MKAGATAGASGARYRSGRPATTSGQRSRAAVRRSAATVGTAGSACRQSAFAEHPMARGGPITLFAGSRVARLEVPTRSSHACKRGRRGRWPRFTSTCRRPRSISRSPQLRRASRARIARYFAPGDSYPRRGPRPQGCERTCLSDWLLAHPRPLARAFGRPSLAVRLSLSFRTRSVRGQCDTRDMSLNVTESRHVVRGPERLVPAMSPRTGWSRPGADTQEDTPRFG